MQIINIYIISLKNKSILAGTIDLYIHLTQQFYEQIYINNIRNIRNSNDFRSQQNCTDNLQGLIFCTLWNDFA